jgi:hypothetical protein
MLAVADAFNSCRSAGEGRSAHGRNLRVCSTLWTKKFGESPTSAMPKRGDCPERIATNSMQSSSQLLAHESLDESEIYAAAAITRPAVTLPR